MYIIEVGVCKVWCFQLNFFKSYGRKSFGPLDPPLIKEGLTFKLPLSEPFWNNLNYASTANITDVTKFMISVTKVLKQALVLGDKVKKLDPSD